MADVIAGIAVLACVGPAIRYIYKEKKKGKCVGCPLSKTCTKCHK